MLVQIMEDLVALGIEFDIFFSEKALSERVVEFAPRVGTPKFYCAIDSYNLMEGPAGGIRDYFTRRAIARAGNKGAFLGFSEKILDSELGELVSWRGPLKIFCEKARIRRPVVAAQRRQSRTGRS